MRYLFLLIAFCISTMVEAQTISDGSITNIANLRKGVLEYDYSKTQITNSSLSFDELNERSDWKKWRPQQENWCRGSLNDDLENIMEFESFSDPEFKLTIVVRYINKDFDDPICDAVFTSSNDGSVLLKIIDLKTSDLNDTGHAIAKFLKKAYKASGKKNANPKF